MGSQHLSPNVKNHLQVRVEVWLGLITSGGATGACLEFSMTSCDVIISGVSLFGIFLGRETSHHVMDASC